MHGGGVSEPNFSNLRDNNGNGNHSQGGVSSGPHHQQICRARAPGLEFIHELCAQIYPQQTNPLTVTAVIKFWLGGPDPLDYISMFDNPGCPELGVPPHWHYVSLGLSDLHGDNRLHLRRPDGPSGFGFELTFRLARSRGETTAPTWPANVMQQLAKYVFNSNNILMPGDHVSWHNPLDRNPGGKIVQILMAKDPQLPSQVQTPHGELSFVQIVGITSEELKAAQHWNGPGVINLLKTSKNLSPWLITDMSRSQSIMEEDPSKAAQIQDGIEREGSNLSGVSAKCWWIQISNGKNVDNYRDTYEPSDDEDEDDGDEIDRLERSRMSSYADSDVEMLEERRSKKVLDGLHLTFNREAGSLLPLAIKGRVMHGRHFTFKSIISHSAVTFVSSSVTGTMVTAEQPYVVQGPWLQCLLQDQLLQMMAQELQVLSSAQQLQLPKTFAWPEYKFAITIVND